MNYLQKAKAELKYWNFLYKSGGTDRIKDYIFENVAFDIENGTNTSGWLEPQDYKEKPENIEHGVRYRASYTSEICNALKAISWMIPVRNASFFDLGCGKGKALMLARKKLPFRRVVGVDYYKKFIDIARNNVERTQLKNIELVHGNAEKFCDFDDLSVIYMYNPFDGYILEQVKKNIERHTKHCIVIYNKPVHLDLFGNWTLLQNKQGWNVDWSTAILSFRNETKIKNNWTGITPAHRPILEHSYAA